MVFRTSHRTQLLGAAFILAAVGAVSAAQAKTLVYCSEGSPENFNPQINTTGTTFDATRPVYNNLVEFKLGTTEIGPGLAEKWDISADGLVYTFHLRKGVKFHSNANFKPSRELTADDVLFSFNRQWKDDNPFHKVSGGEYSYFGDMGFPKLLKSVEKIDDYTVKITLNEPQAPFLADLGMDFASIMSAEYADVAMKKGKPELVDQEPIGTGPFEFQKYEKDSQVRYKIFKDYWGPKAKVDLVFAITKDPSVRLAKLQNGECHIAPYPNVADLPRIREDARLKMQDQPGLNIGYLAMNVTKKPFDDVRVRQAVNMAIDKKAILDAVFQGAGTTAKTLIPPTIWAYSKDITDYPHDLEAAKKLLAEAGYPNGFETDLWAMPVQRPYNPDAGRIGELMQADLAKIGVKAKIVRYEWGEYRKRAQQGEHQMAQLGWTGDNGDPDNFFVPLLSCDAARPGGGNISKWCNKQYDELNKKAAVTTEQAERIKLYKQAQDIIKAEAPQVLVAHSVQYMPMRKEVEGYKISPFARHEFNEVELK